MSPTSEPCRPNLIAIRPTTIKEIHMHRSRPVRLFAATAAALVASATAVVVVPGGTAFAVGGPTLSIFAGTGKAGSPTPGPATSSAMNVPNGIGFDPSGNLYLVDSNNNVVEKVTPARTLSIFAGNGKVGAPTPGPATSSDLNGPGAVVFDWSGNAYIADSGNNMVERVTPSGSLSIFAGTGKAGAPTPGPATSSALDSLNQIAFDPSGNLYITDSGNSVVEKVTPSGSLSIFAGIGKAGVPTPGPARSSALNYPGGVAVDSSGNVYIADFGNDVVEKVTPSGTLSIFAGTGKVGAPTPGPARSSALGGPAFVAVDSSGRVYIADFGANLVERVTPSGTLSIFAGTGKAGAPTPGPATSSALDQPVGVAVDSSGEVYIGDASNNVVEKVTLPVPTTPSITNLPSSGLVGGAFTPSVATTGDGGTAVSSNSPSVCAVTGSTVTYVGMGTCSLTARVGIGAVYGARWGVPQMFTVASPCSGGYWIAGADGAVYPFGSAADYGSLVSSGVTPAKPIVGIAATADCKGYWLVASDGGVFAFGDAHYYGSMGGQPLNRPVVGMASTPQGGYYELASDGGIFSFGPGADFDGSMGGQPLNQPVVGMASTPQGGYYEVASDGGIFSFGPGADFDGSMGGQPLNRPVVGMADNPTGGYYEVASDGGIFSFGAPFHGSTGCLSLSKPILSMVVSPDLTTVGTGTACGFTGGQAPGGYQFVASDGGVFSFGNATYAGSLGGTGITDVVGMANG
jgi:sugar lactone lactonase YvrE